MSWSTCPSKSLIFRPREINAPDNHVLSEYAQYLKSPCGLVDELINTTRALCTDQSKEDFENIAEVNKAYMGIYE